LEADIGAIYHFKAVSTSRDTLQGMANGIIPFQDGAQSLSRDFSRLHGATTREGAFFIFELRGADPYMRLYSLIKYDYREAIEQAEEKNGQQRLRRIIHAFTNDKKAIQKSVLIRVINGQAETMVAARDRTRPAPEIAEYFATFLDVERTCSDDELNRKLVEALRRAFQESKDFLPNQDVASALRKAKIVLRDSQQINEDVIVNAVIAAADHPDSEETRTLLRRKIVRCLHAQRLTGLEFPPNRTILRKPPLRKVRTAEGVTVTYPDGADEITVRRERHQEGEGETIIITTERVVEDAIVPNPAR